jgi:hypothetical protein
MTSSPLESQASIPHLPSTKRAKARIRGFPTMKGADGARPGRHLVCLATPMGSMTHNERGPPDQEGGPFDPVRPSTLRDRASRTLA